MRYENEEWCKVWKGIDLSFQNWHEEFDELWPEHLKVSQIFISMCSLWAKYMLFELKKYRGVVSHETEEGYKIWREINLSFQHWHKEFDKFCPEHSKFSKMFTLMGSFWEKFILFELKKYRGVIFHKTEEVYKIWRAIDCRGVIFHGIEEWCKIWRKTDFLLGKWHEEFCKFSPEHSKVSKLELW